MLSVGSAAAAAANLSSPQGSLGVLAGIADALPDGRAVEAHLLRPDALAADAAGNVYVVDAGHGVLRRISPDGRIITIGALDALVPDTTSLLGENALAVDARGNAYLAVQAHHVVLKIGPGGETSVYAGQLDHAGHRDGASAVAQLSGPVALAMDERGRLLVAEGENGTIRRVEPNGQVSTFARGLDGLFAIAVDSRGTVGAARCVAPAEGGRDVCTIDRLDAEGGRVTLDGTGPEVDQGIAVSGDDRLVTADGRNLALEPSPAPAPADVAASDATAADPGDTWPSFSRGVAIDRGGHVYISDQRGFIVRQDAIHSRLIAGRDPRAAKSDDDPIVWRRAQADAAGRLWILNTTGEVRPAMPDGRLGEPVNVAGIGSTLPPLRHCHPPGSGVPGAIADCDNAGFAIDANGALHLANRALGRKKTPERGCVELVFTPGRPTTWRSLDGWCILDLAADARGRVYLYERKADSAGAASSAGQDRIERVDADGHVEQIGAVQLPSTRQRETHELVTRPETAFAVGDDGAIYVATPFFVGRLTQDGSLRPIAGAPFEGGSNDGPGDSARFDGIQGIAVAADKTLYVSDVLNGAVRRIAPDRSVTTLTSTRGAGTVRPELAVVGALNALGGLAMLPNGRLVILNGESALVTTTAR